MGEVQPIDELIAAVRERIDARRVRPESTYRLQFHAGFTFAHATAIVPYLHELGITHVYASPYLKARPGSTHGYDVIDHCKLNPELGSEEDYAAFVDALRRHGMGHIVDIVPNHVGVGTNDNAWWNDVLENGPESAYADYFDIDWQGSPRPELHNKVLLPVLGEPYGDALEQGKLKPKFENGALEIHYYDRRFPISPRTYRQMEIGQIEELQGEPGKPRTFDRLDELLNKQSYRLSYWRSASDEINYRRFFDINDLAALRMERPEVFDATHGFILRLLAQGKIDGLRIDHPDGLYDPAQYFRRLQQEYVLACARELISSNPRFRDIRWEAARARVVDEIGGDGSLPLYVVAEKILAHGEPLPSQWAVSGTTGYDFLAMVNSLFVQQSNADAFTGLYHQHVPRQAGYADTVYEKKKLILEISLASELHMLAHRLDRLAQANRHSRDFTLGGLLRALREVIACFPVYRSYISDREVSDADRQYVETAIRRARQRNPKLDPLVFDFIGDTLLLRYSMDESLRPAQREFAGKFQQVTAPVTAKGIEDTTFYIYNRLVSLNEVGGDPDHFGVAPEALHAYLKQRQESWTYGLSPLSTHDTKRSQDVRARINVLSEMPQEWAARVERWSRGNAPHRQQISGVVAPDANDEYLLYQTLIGAWPLEPLGENERALFVQRIQAYMEKAMREAKVHTSWTSPNVEYERAVRQFITRILDPQSAQEFLGDFRPFQQRISHWGLLNSLSQTLLRIAAPGVPDTYQGTELWDFSLVDPDNRRPVEYRKRDGMLADLKQSAERAGLARSTLAAELLQAKEDGRVKLFVTWLGLLQRRTFPGLFSAGEYLPAHEFGSRSDHVFAFVRRQGTHRAVAIVPRLLSSLVPEPGQLPLGEDVWGDTGLLLPGIEAGQRLRNVFTGQMIGLRSRDEGRYLPVAEALGEFPVALFVSE